LRLAEPVELFGLRLKNRIVMPPMNTELATEDGAVTDDLIEHYRARAPRLGLVIVEHSYVGKDGKLSPRQLGVYDDSLEEGLKRLSRAVKSTGTPVFIQINHAGMRAEESVTGTRPVGPSALEGTRELNVEEIRDIVEAFGQATARAVRSGFDGVEVHGAHGFLLNQFASPVTNRRRDQYGGDLEGRMRLPLEVVERVRRETKGEVHLWYRLGADDRQPGGNTVEEAGEMARMLVDAGVEVIDVSGGLCGSRPEGVGGVGYFAYAAHAVKAASGAPVVAVGGVRSRQDAEEVLSRWNVDLVAVGRAILEDPSWPERELA